VKSPEYSSRTCFTTGGGGGCQAKLSLGYVISEIEREYEKRKHIGKNCLLCPREQAFDYVVIKFIETRKTKLRKLL
jgi:hypothetical protein